MSPLDLIEDNGRLSSRKFMEFGSWVATTIIVLLYGFRGTLSAELLGIYAGVFVLGRFAGQSVHAYRDVQQARIASREHDDDPPDEPQREVVRPKRARLLG